MKLKKYLGIICLTIAFLLSGCSHEPYGKVEQITVMQMQEKMKNGENFAVVLTQTGCPGCKTFLSIMDDYLYDHSMVLYDIVLDKEGDRTQAVKELKTIFPNFTGTPDIYYLEDGKVKSNLNEELESGAALDEDAFHTWAEKYNLLEEK